LDPKFPFEGVHKGAKFSSEDLAMGNIAPEAANLA